MGKEYETFAGTHANDRDSDLFDVWIRHENKLEYIRALDREDLLILKNAIDERLNEAPEAEQESPVNTPYGNLNRDDEDWFFSAND